MTQTQIRDIETNGTDLGSERVGKQRETENGHKPETVKGRQNGPEQKRQTAKQKQKAKKKTKEQKTDRRNSKSLKDSKKKTDTWTKGKTEKKNRQSDR